MSDLNDNLVSTDWLEEHLTAPDIVVFDASWHMPAEGRDARAEFLAEHIPGALFFDIDALSDTESALPHMLPPPEKFAAKMRRLGVGDGKQIVCYDTKGLFSAARAWWMFKVFGHNDVAILDGGMAKWKAEGRPLEDGPAGPRQERHFTARLNATSVSDAADVLRAVQEHTAQIVDARSASRFSGVEPEPREGLRSGHMPGARNVHYAVLLNPDGTLKRPSELRSAFESAGVDLSRPVITSCGSGVTAAILSLALEAVDHHEHSLYDGSWTEWGGRDELPVVTGE